MYDEIWRMMNFMMTMLRTKKMIRWIMYGVKVLETFELGK